MVLLQIGLMLVVFLLLFFSFRILLPRYYQREKVKTIRSLYTTLNEMVDDYDDDDENDPDEDDFSDDIRKLASENNLQVLITDSDFNVLNSTTRESQEMGFRLFGYYTGYFQEGLRTLEDGDHYRIQISNDLRVSLNYLEMWGFLDNGNWFLIRTPLQSMEEAAHLSQLLLAVIGTLAVIAGAILIFFVSKRFTRPITQLTEISKRMAGQDFSVKYEGETENEIGQLGEHFNKMSDELEHTISSLKTANAELERDMAEKEELEEKRTAFLNNVSHELKTPLSLIQGYAEGLKDNVASDVESRDYYCDVILDETGKMTKMVQQLLALNQLEQGREVLNITRFDLTELIRDVIKDMSILFEQEGISVTFLQTEPVYVWGDAFQIEEVVTNYFSNAIHHASGKKEIEVRIEREGSVVRTDVFNTGSPVPQDDLPRLFEPFYKVDKARTREYGGSGIGLSIVKAVMDAHNQSCGAVNFRNGVAFFFTLDGSAGA